MLQSTGWQRAGHDSARVTVHPGMGALPWHQETSSLLFCPRGAHPALSVPHGPRWRLEFQPSHLFFRLWKCCLPSLSLISPIDFLLHLNA